MIYAVVSDGAIAACGFLEQLFPEIAEIRGVGPAWFAANSVQPVQMTRPYDAATERLEECATYLDDGVAYGVRAVALPLAEQEALRAIKAQEVRAERNARLAACDWTQISDAPLSDAGKAAWTTYRQALRDVPAQSGFPWAIVWPAVPA